jgi:hypothetical protein
MSSRWVVEQQFKGGRVVICRLCGKRATRRYNAANTNYAEAIRAAEDYAREHEASDAHRGALDAYFGEDAPDVSHEELLLAEIFGSRPSSEVQRRRRAARGAYRRISREGVAPASADEH